MEEAELDRQLMRIHDHIDVIVTTQGEIQALLARVDTRFEERCEPCQRKVNRLNKAVYGNGNMGLVVTVDRLKKDADTRKATPGESVPAEKLSIKAFCLLVAAIGTLVGTLAGAIGAAAATMANGGP